MTPRHWILIALGAALLIGLASAAWLRSRPGAGIAGLERLPADGRQHVQGKVDYGQRNNMPPTSGNHASIWQNCGVYDREIPLETAVHSLEHGSVWVTYRPDLDKASVAKLREFMYGKPYTLLSVLKNQPSKLSVVAWNARLRLKAFDAMKLEAFIKTFVQGPETPEKEAACIGGNGVPWFKQP